MVFLDNIRDGEQVHQRCILVRGWVRSTATDSPIQISTHDQVGDTIFPDQQWPVSKGIFRALLLLSPGLNSVEFAYATSQTRTINITYIPLLQSPPLHLAIMVAKDSPLVSDRSPSKQPISTSAHPLLNAAIAKLRMTAYMWQAQIADELYRRGLGRRSFRLEEEWSVDTVSKHYLWPVGVHRSTQSTAKVHLVCVDKTVAELQAANLRQDHDFDQVIKDALRHHGRVFTSTPSPLIASLVLDSHYSLERGTIPAHPTLACHSPNGISVGVMSSHLACAWPRFVEEVAACLSDTDPTGPMISGEYGRCTSMWEACAIGQMTFWRQVELAMGVSRDHEAASRWVGRFLPQIAHTETDGEPKPNIRAITKLSNSDLFWMPGDQSTEHITETRLKEPTNESPAHIHITNGAGIAMIWIDGEEHADFVSNPDMTLVRTEFSIPLDDLETEYCRSQPLMMEVLGMNGKSKKFDLRKYCRSLASLNIPRTTIKLMKKSVETIAEVSDEEISKRWQWTVMLKKRGKNGVLARATQIDIRVGAILDGAEVYYNDGSKMQCGRRWDEAGADFGMGGHQAKKMALPKSTEIVKVAVNAGEPGSSSSVLQGLRMWRSDGKVLGALNAPDRSCVKIVYLEPDESHRIVGFYGCSSSWGYCAEFGILTAPKDVELPDSAYDWEELQNTDGGLGPRFGKKQTPKRGFEDVDSSDSDSIPEDEDTGYDWEEGDETMDEDE